MWDRTPLLDRLPRLKGWLARHPRAAKGFLAYLILRWIVGPAMLAMLFAMNEGWLR